MTPKEKAKDLVELFSFNCRECDNAKLSALIAVDEIIKSNPTNPLRSDFIILYSEMIDDAINYWQQVKTEIENL